jgi:hypothetical protein
MSDKQRLHQRKPWPLNIKLQIADNNQVGPDLQAETVDMSAGGICIITNQPLATGTVLNFGATQLKGVVRWSTPVDTGFKIGIELIK